MLRRIVYGVLILICVHYLLSAALVSAQRRHLVRKMGVRLAQWSQVHGTDEMVSSIEREG